MSHTFKIGDHVEVIRVPGLWYTNGEHLIGQRGVIVSNARLIPDAYVPSHLVDFGGRSFNFVPECLRKIDDDRDSHTLDSVEPLKVVRWIDCPWRPAGVRA